MRSDRHRKKRRWKKIFVLFLFILGGVIGYSYFQYKQGVNQSLKKLDGEREEEQMVYKFEGKKDQYGGTNILLLGSDARGKEKSRADTIMIAHYNEDKGTFKLTSIMRDSYVDIPGRGKHKINSAFAYGGPELMRQTIKKNFDIDLQYYAIVNFQGFVHLIDEAFPNGVEIDVEKKMSKNIDVTLEPGLQRLNGEQLLGYVRFRQDAVGDFGRVERQQKAVKAIGEQLSSIQTIAKLPKLVGVLTPYVNTNMDTSDMIFIGKDFFSGNRGTVETLRIPVEDGFTETRVKGEGFILKLDLEKNKQALHEFITK
ncbi:LCP family protein [Neobacillus thermocopriae]|uniref:Regulatory protein MsrR n=1 Tax=Neobacillus thermocopriae TaxID=1215031 RepID=A0A6B3TQF5_9BACI|nr:LCP family protein [Neobacillus thermocopriae]MED3623068.1 LCP family protein [Neobacillus thermocopriae]MED3714963.1 LCP family protein [Neobacillus thermocopriae]NEX78818.1 LCP family protein [Neobacillus thermocopriae]